MRKLGDGVIDNSGLYDGLRGMGDLFLVMSNRPHGFPMPWLHSSTHFEIVLFRDRLYFAFLRKAISRLGRIRGKLRP